MSKSRQEIALQAVAAGKTQTEAAKLVGVTQQTVSKWIRTKGIIRKPVIIDKCQACLKYTSVDGSKLCTRCAYLIKQGHIITFKETINDKRGSIIGFSLRDTGLMPTKQCGSIYLRSDWQVISKLVSQFYKAISDKEIKKYNISRSTRYRIPGSPPPKAGFVYLLRSENGYYKIGRTENIQTRLKSIQREYPIEIRLIHFWECDNYIETESALHELYRDYRKGLTEWFLLPSTAVDEICNLP